MKIKIVVITPVGQFESDIQDMSDNDTEELKILFENINDLDYLKIDSNRKNIYFPSSILKNSVLVIAPVS